MHGRQYTCSRMHKPELRPCVISCNNESQGVSDTMQWLQVLLVVLYMMQGVPLGLTMGAMPLLLASKASYTQVCAALCKRKPLSAEPYTLPYIFQRFLHVPVMVKSRSALDADVFPRVTLFLC